MPFYEFVAVDPSGKKVKSIIKAKDRKEAFKKLVENDLVVINIKESPIKEPEEEKTVPSVMGREKAEEEAGGTGEGVGEEGEETAPGQRRLRRGRAAATEERGRATAGTIEALPHAPEGKKGITIGFLSEKLSAKDLSVFARELAALIEAGVGIVEALELVADSIDNPYLKKELPRIAEEIKGGVSFSRALKRRLKKMDEFFISMVEVGEETGQLDLVLRRIADYYKGISEIINRIKSASFYPAFVTVMATLITLGILYFLVPKFAQIYHAFGGELPALTQAVLDASQWLKRNFIWLILGVIVVFAIYTFLYRYVYGFKKAVHWIQLKLPLVGPVFLKGILAKFARTFATLFASGVSIERSLELSARVVGNVIYQEAIAAVRTSIVFGEPVWKAFQKTGKFPKIFVSMLRVGEETGRLDAMLESLADFYDDELKAAIEALISMIEPVMIVVIGGIIGFILIALYLPIFRLGSLVK